MKEWCALYEAHGAMRAIAPTDLLNSLRSRLVRLAERGHCEGTIRGRFSYSNRGPLRELHVHGPDGSVPLLHLEALEAARLTVLALVSRRTDHVHQFTAMIEGTASGERSWVAAVHLVEDHVTGERDRQGSGACGHAAFHCHVGPTFDHEPKVRVPLPVIGPAGALDWLLSIVVPDWEPAPWPAVVAARQST